MATPGYRDTPQYRSVLEHQSAIAETIIAIKGVEKLAREYKTRSFVDITTEMTPGDLVDLALTRIKNDPVSGYEQFITILKEVTGTDQIVAKLEKTCK